MSIVTRIIGQPASIVAGRIRAKLFPPGDIGSDGNKYGWTTYSDIVSSSITSLSLLKTSSLTNSNAFYVVDIWGKVPQYHSQELWRVQTADNTLNVNSVIVLTNTPVY